MSSAQSKTINIIPGKAFSVQKLKALSERIKKANKHPRLCIIQIGGDPSSTLYVNNKVLAAKEIGINAEAYRFAEFDSEASQQEVLDLINKLNEDNSVHGIMVQAPIPGLTTSQAQVIFNTINVNKDVDGLSASGLGRLWQLKSALDLNSLPTDEKLLVAATPKAVLDCLAMLEAQFFGSSEDVAVEVLGNTNNQQSSGIQINTNLSLLNGKRVLIINRSNIVGKPLAALALMHNATVTIAHSRTDDLKTLIAEHDIIFTGTGVDGMWKLSDFKQGQIVIDIGINSTPGEKVRGDIDLGEIDEYEKYSLGSTGNFDISDALHIAAVPGGVGPLTIANLLENTVLAAGII